MHSAFRPFQAIHWGARDPKTRGPIIVNQYGKWAPNAIGAHGGDHSVYIALGHSVGLLDHAHRPDLSHTLSAIINPNERWFDPNAIVTLDPYGQIVGRVFEEERNAGADIRPSIAVTSAEIQIPEIRTAIDQGRLKPDGRTLDNEGWAKVTKMAIEQVWHLPGLAHRLDIDEGQLRENLVRGTNGMYPDLVNRPDLNIYMPPVGGTSVYAIGDTAKLADPKTKVTVRVHDECNGSDVFGADICTCRPYLMFGVEECIKTAMEEGVGVIVYNRKEGRGLGEVIKLAVYNARRQQPGGDRHEMYFERTRAVAGVQDLRFQMLMPDVLHWLGISTIHQLISMSPDKYNAICQAGIEVVRGLELPEGWIPRGANVEITAKRAAGYQGRRSKIPSSYDP